MIIVPGTKAYSEPCQMSKMEILVPLNIFTKAPFRLFAWVLYTHL